MFLNSILIFLGIMTTFLGIFNLITGSYIWGTLFILGGIWSIGLGIYYLIQDEKEKKRLKSMPKQEEEFSVKKHPVDEGLLTQDLFEVDELTRQMINNGSLITEQDEPSDQTAQGNEVIVELTTNDSFSVTENSENLNQDLNDQIQNFGDLNDDNSKTL